MLFSFLRHVSEMSARPYLNTTRETNRSCWRPGKDADKETKMDGFTDTMMRQGH